LKAGGVWLKYAGAFASGYVEALLPVLATGVLPEGKALIAAFAAGLVATGLFHCPSPQAKD